MKTLHLYLIAIAATLAACSSDEAIAPATGDLGGDDICFSPAVADPVSRADAGVDLAALQESGFWVKAVKIDGTSLWPNTETGDMLHFVYNTSARTFKPDLTNLPEGANYDGKWPTGQTLFLYASNIPPTKYKISKRNNTSDPEYGGQVYTQVGTQAADVTTHEDYVYATNYGTRADFSSGAVPLYFKHALCQIEVQAKNENPLYTVKVKGYMLHFPDMVGTFLFPTPNVIGSTAALAATEPDCQWLDRSMTSSGGAAIDFVSGYVNGFTTSGTGIYDDDEDNYFTLNATPQTIKNNKSETGDPGYAYIIPHGRYSSTITNSFCIYLIVQIDYNLDDGRKLPLFPACQILKDADGNKDELANNLDTRVAYSGLPKYYGRVYVPYTFASDWQNYAGKKVTFVLDFTNGLGYIDRHRPDVVDATDSNYNAADGTGTVIESSTSTVKVDPYSKYDLVLGDMGVTTLVSDWTDLTATSNMTTYTATSPTP